MAQIDPNIPLSVKSFQAPDPIKAQESAYKVQEMQQASQMNQMAMSQMQQDAQDHAATTNVIRNLSPEEAKDPSSIRQKILNNGGSLKSALEMEKTFRSNDTVETEQQIKKLQLKEAQIKMFDTGNEVQKKALVEINDKIATILSTGVGNYDAGIKNGLSTKDAGSAARTMEISQLKAYTDELTTELQDPGVPQDRKQLIQGQIKMFGARLQSIQGKPFDIEETRQGAEISSEVKAHQAAHLEAAKVKTEQVKAQYAEPEVRAKIDKEKAQADKARAEAWKARQTGQTGDNIPKDDKAFMASAQAALGETGSRGSKAAIALRQQSLEQIHNENPNMSPAEVAQKYNQSGGETKAIQATIQAFDKGPEAKLVRSLNVGVQHLGTLDKTIDAMHNFDTQGLNKVYNSVATEFGGTKATNLDMVGQIVAGEILKATGGSISVTESEAVKHKFASANSPAQLKEAAQYARELMAGQLKGLRTQFTSSGAGTADVFNKKLDSETRSALGDNQKSAPTVSNW